MSKLTDYLEDALLDHFLNNTAYTQTTVHLSLHTSTNSDSAAGTEVSGNNYSRQNTAFDAASGGSSSNTDAETFTASGGSWGTVVSVALYDASSGGNQLVYDNDFNDTAVDNGSTLTFDAGDITATLD